MPRSTSDSEAIEISEIPVEAVSIPIRGTAPLIIHRFSEKMKQAMLDAMQGRRTPKEPKNPEAEYAAAFHRIKGGEGFGFPAVGFKAATVGAARYFGRNQVTMVGLRQCIFFHGEPGQDGNALVRLEGEPRMREDVVRVNRGGSDLRYRPEFPEWSATLLITYVKSMLTRSSLATMIDGGGMGVGVGEWRPEKGGDFGTYEIDPTRDIEVLQRKPKIEV